MLSNEKYLQAKNIEEELSKLKADLIIFQSGNFGKIDDELENKIFALRRSIGELNDVLKQKTIEYVEYSGKC